MSQDRKHLLVVDDSEIDRMIFKGIVNANNGFEIMEAESAYAAFDLLSKIRDGFDAIMLDIVMPYVDGFEVLKYIRDNHLDDIPVFLVTSEATVENINRAKEFGITDFIRKPFDQEDMLRRLKSRLGVIPDATLTPDNITATNQYISELEGVFKNYLTNFEKQDDHYVHMAGLVKILLSAYSRTKQGAELDLTKDKIDFISRAAYLCNIGYMLVPEKTDFIMRDPAEMKAMRQNHIMYGSDIVRLNHSKDCEYFVDICADMCLHHHERYDGKGYPHGIKGRYNSVFNQICRLADEFDSLLSKLYGHNRGMQTNFVIKNVMRDEGIASPEILALLEENKRTISQYYTDLEQGK